MRRRGTAYEQLSSRLMNFILKSICCIGLISVSGCTVYEASRQTHFAREYMTEDFETQIMFNLIRAVNGLPFEHYDVQQLQSVVTSSVTPSGGVGRTTTTNSFLPFAVVGSAIQTIVRPYSFNISANRQSVITAVINPVTDNPDVYAAYAEFLNYGHGVMQKKGWPEIGYFGKDVVTVRFGPARPTADYIERTVTFWDGNYYWIPSNYMPQYARLWMKLLARKPSSTGASDQDLKALRLENLNSTNRTYLSPPPSQ